MLDWTFYTFERGQKKVNFVQFEPFKLLILLVLQFWVFDKPGVTLI